MNRFLTWQWVCRTVGLSLIIVHVLTASAPDAGVILALVGLAGFPSFVDLDRKREGGK